ncbi:MAG: DUF4956 domain-containing protein, partial [Myxococcales bacterium]|nr:DUF4956 domain-containing protein [Myxococcales bacterium]
MNEFVRALTEGWGGALHITPFELLVSMVCALACGFIISETYRRTHRGGDYSRSFLQVLILVAIIVAFVTLVVGNDLARAFTLVGALSVVRFRTAVKDARDLGFIFWGVATGMGSGVQLLSITLLATVAIAVVVFILDATSYGSRDPNLKVIRIRIDSKADYETAFAPFFKEYLAEV